MVYVQRKMRKKDRNVFWLPRRNTHSCLGAHSSLLPLFWQHQKVIQNNSSPASAHFLSASYTRALLFTNTLLHLKASAHAEYPGYSILNAGVSVPQKTQINAPPPPTHLAENISVDLRTTSRGAFNSYKMQMRSAAKIPARIKQNRDRSSLENILVCQLEQSPSWLHQSGHSRHEGWGID